MTIYEKGFAFLAEAYANNALPEDEGRWEFIGPPTCDLSIEEILTGLAESDAVMPDPISSILGLSSQSTYAGGVQRICEDRTHRMPVTRTAAPVQRGDGSDVVADEAAFLRELEEMDTSPTRVARTPGLNWRRVGF